MSRLKEIYGCDDWSREHDSWYEYEYYDSDTDSRETYYYYADEELVDELIIEYLAEKQNISKEEAEEQYRNKYFTKDEQGFYYEIEEKIDEDFGAMLHDYFYNKAMREIED